MEPPLLTLTDFYFRRNMKQPNYYAIIPAAVRYDNRLRANEKLMYGEITALTNKTGECWASNRYFAELYDVTTASVSKWIKHLEEMGYITTQIIYKDNSKEVAKRIIKLAGVLTFVDGGINICLGGYQQKFKDNNTSNNNIKIINDDGTLISQRLSDEEFDKLDAKYENLLDLLDMIDNQVVEPSAIKKPYNYICAIADKQNWERKLP